MTSRGGGCGGCGEGVLAPPWGGVVGRARVHEKLHLKAVQAPLPHASPLPLLLAKGSFSQNTLPLKAPQGTLECAATTQYQFAPAGSSTYSISYKYV